MRIASLLVLAGLVAGCAHIEDAASPFDGAAALQHASGLALGADGLPRYRIPGTVGQREGAAFLWNATDMPGWTRSFENFTGADYQRLDLAPVASYVEGSAYCPARFARELPNMTFSNLLATRPGPPGSPVVVLGAHWDSQPESNYDPDPAKKTLPDPGANDGASGVGVLLQLMRELEGRDLAVTLRLFFIDGEDGFFACYPLAGSLWHVQRGGAHEDAFVLLDMVGDPGALFPREFYSTLSAPDLVDLIWSHGDRLAPEHFVNTTARIEDDHIAYTHAGIPAVDIIDAGRPGTFPPQWDTTGDTVDKLDAKTMGQVGDVLLAVLNDPSLSSKLG